MLANSVTLRRFILMGLTVVLEKYFKDSSNMSVGFLCCHGLLVVVDWCRHVI
jgi:hypothetical protein